MSMRRVIIACAVGAFLLGALMVVSSTLGWGGRARGKEVWWYEGSGPLIKATFRTTGNGIIQEWRYEPEDLKLIFKPADRFSEPAEGDHSLWTFSPASYTIDKSSPGALSDFFAEGAQYWLQIMVQD
jgi:hypothetical protein